MKMKKINGFVLAFMLLSPLGIKAVEIGDVSLAVNFSGRHRAFTQRMLKEYAMICLENNYNNPKEVLKEGIVIFEDLITSLIEFNKDKETAESLQEGLRLWEPVKKLLHMPPSKENATKLQIAMESLTDNTNATTALFAKQTGKTSGKITNYSGQQRVLSQKMASLYLLKSYGVTSANFQAKMEATMKWFSKNLHALTAYEKNTEEIQKLLEIQRKAFRFFEIMDKNTRTFIPTLIYEKSNVIFDAANTATRLYSELGSKENKRK